MSLEKIDRIARTVLYEGYMLYPYRSSNVKNRYRWNFGVLVPRRFTDSGERSQARAEVLFTGGTPEARLRFLQMAGGDVVEREVVGSGSFEFGVLRGMMKVTVDESRVVVEVENTTAGENLPDREAAIPFSLLSAHVALTLTGGTFISARDPRSAACRNEGLYPVLISDRCVLASPIILDDYPQVAPESAGDLFDATEIDEILTLRILTLSDEEKEEIRRGDARTRALLERTEALTPQQMAALHGAMRGFRPGDRVRLRPRRRADIMDIVLAGRVAIIESIESDFDDNIHFAVVVEDDPGRDLGLLRQPGHRFFFSPEEVEPL